MGAATFGLNLILAENATEEMGVAISLTLTVLTSKVSVVRTGPKADMMFVSGDLSPTPATTIMVTPYHQSAEVRTYRHAF